MASKSVALADRPTAEILNKFLDSTLLDESTERGSRREILLSGLEQTLAYVPIDSEKDEKSMAFEFSLEEKSNLQKLLTLCDPEKPEDRLFMAEINRELGKFAEAREILDFEFPEEFRKAASAIGGWSEKQVRIVMEIHPDS